MSTFSCLLFFQWTRPLSSPMEQTNTLTYTGSWPRHTEKHWLLTKWYLLTVLWPQAVYYFVEDAKGPIIRYDNITHVVWFSSILKEKGNALLKGEALNTTLSKRNYFFQGLKCFMVCIPPFAYFLPKDFIDIMINGFTNLIFHFFKLRFSFFN